MHMEKLQNGFLKGICKERDCTHRLVRLERLPKLGQTVPFRLYPDKSL
jgi:hypothetical protein